MKKRFLYVTAAFCLSMMLFTGCGNMRKDTGNGAEHSALPEDENRATDDFENGAENALDDAGEGAKDVIDGARDAVDGVGEGAKDVIDGAKDAVDGAADGTNDIIDDASDENHDNDTNNSVTSGKKK